MEDFEELEGPAVEESTDHIEDNDDDMAGLAPVQASTMNAEELRYELSKRGIAATGFADSDRDNLQRALDQEFVRDLEEIKEKRRELKRKASKQAAMQRRRTYMEALLREEQDEMGKDTQMRRVLSLIKQNVTAPAMQISLNSVLSRCLSKTLRYNTSITALDLSSNSLSDHSGAYLARSLTRNRTLRRLDLDNNMLSVRTASALGESLATNDVLEAISLDSNDLTRGGSDFSGVTALASALAVNPALTSLNLFRTCLMHQGGAAIAEAVDGNPRLFFLDIAHNSVDACDERRIRDRLAHNVRMHEARERDRRHKAEEERMETARLQAEEDARRKVQELHDWLESERSQRAEERRRTFDEEAERRRIEEEERLKAEQARIAEEARLKAEAEAKKAAKEAKKGKKK